MNEELESRLINYKFEDATAHLEGEDDDTKSVVEALARMFGNPGWFDGDMALIIDVVLQKIGVKYEDD